MEMEFLSKINLTQELKKYVSNTGYMFFGKIVNKILSLVVGIYVARYLGPENYGLLNYAQSFVALFGVFATLGLNDILVRELVDNSEKEQTMLGTALSLKIVAGLLITIVTIGVGFLTSNDQITQYLIIICSGTLFLQFAKVFDHWFQAKVLAKYSEIANVVTYILVSLLKLAFIFLQFTVIYFAFAVIASSFIRLILLVWQFLRRGNRLGNLQFDSTVAKKFLRESWPLIFAGLNITVAMKIDQIMIKQMLDVSNVGVYAVGVKLADSMSFLPLIVTSSLFPKLVELWGNGIFWDRYAKIFKYILWPLISIAIIIGFGAEFIIQILFGSEYINAWPVLSIYIWTLPLTFSGLMTNKYLLLINKSRSIFFRQFFMTVLNVISNLIFIPIFGLIGAALSTIVPQLVINIFYDLYDKDLRRVLQAKIYALSFGLLKY
jgi:O-antigen/teichoic acid export membrane protein